MKKEDLVLLLNGREYGNEITEKEAETAKENNLVVIFGYSDDNVELRGAVNDEIGAYNGVEFYIDKANKKIYYTVERYIDEHELNEDFSDIVQNYFDNNCIKITAKLNNFWEIKAEGIEFENFDIMEDGEKFCRGIVIDLS